MPLYEFECYACGQTSEKIIKMSDVDASIVECPLCGERMKRKISVSNFHLKGSGWAKDNYCLKNTKKSKEKHDG